MQEINGLSFPLPSPFLLTSWGSGFGLLSRHGERRCLDPRGAPHHHSLVGPGHSGDASTRGAHVPYPARRASSVTTTWCRVFLIKKREVSRAENQDNANGEGCSLRLWCCEGSQKFFFLAGYAFGPVRTIWPESARESRCKPGRRRDRIFPVDDSLLFPDLSLTWTTSLSNPSCSSPGLK